jgi:hypothetical protein
VEFIGTPVEIQRIGSKVMIALFEKHLEEMVVYLRYEGVPRFNYPAEHECRKVRALEKRCYGWADIAFPATLAQSTSTPSPLFHVIGNGHKKCTSAGFLRLKAPFHL